LAVLTAVALLARYQIYPSVVRGADAWGYQFYAFRFRQYGIFHDFGTIRTYGYPLFLYVLTYVSGFDGNRLSLVAGTVQFGLFLAATVWLASQVSHISRRLGLAILIGLLLNPLLVSLVTDALTEGLSVFLYVLLVALAFKFDGAKSGRTGILALGAMVAAATLMVRPANLAVVLAWHLAVAATIARHKVRTERGALAAAAVSSLIAAAAFVWGPQVTYNLISHGKASFLPVCELGGFQSAYSIIAWKYDTLVAGDAAGPWNYLNPLFRGHLNASSGWRWYLDHPIAGAATLAAHIFNAFSVTNLFTYIRDLNPPYSVLLRAVYWSLTVIGLLGVWRYARSVTRGGARYVEPTSGLAVTFLALSLLLVTALNSISAVEVRFNVLPIGILSVVTIDRLLAYRSQAVQFSWPTVLVCSVLIVACVAGSYAMDRLGTAGMEGRSFEFDMAQQRCFLVGGSASTNLSEALNDFERFMHNHREATDAH
jgi:hypothetical protein